MIELDRFSSNQICKEHACQVKFSVLSREWDIFTRFYVIRGKFRRNDGSLHRKMCQDRQQSTTSIELDRFPTHACRNFQSFRKGVFTRLQTTGENFRETMDPRNRKIYKENSSKEKNLGTRRERERERGDDDVLGGWRCVWRRSSGPRLIISKQAEGRTDNFQQWFITVV